MKSQRLTLTFVAGLGLALALFWLVGSMARADATSVHYVAPTGSDSGDCTAPGGPCRTVQYAVDQAGDGDTIKIAAGTYTSTASQVVAIAKNITITGGYAPPNWSTSAPAANPTILDGENARRVVLVTLLISPTLEGLTLQRGNAAGQDGDPPFDAGGAVYSLDASPTITNCRILSSTAGVGAGLALYKGTPTVANNVIAGNVATQTIATLTRGAGGGVLLYQSGGVVAGNLIANNVASGTQMYDGGGGLYLDVSTTLIRNNTIQGNRGPHNGGGMIIYGSAVVVQGNTILGNSAGSGGGVLLASSPANFEANTVIGNGSTAMGGGFAIFDSVNFTLTNNVVAQNYGAYPAGLFAGGSAPGLSSQGVLIHNTFADNPAALNPWTIHLGTNLSQPATLVFTNNIIGLPGGVYVDTNSTAVLNTTLWDKIPIGMEWFGTGTIISSTNLYGNADFVGQYRISPRSAAIDQGANAGIATDIDGEARPNGPKPDVGADEFYCYALGGVSITGPTSGVTGTTYTFTAAASPPTATLLVTYTWQASGQPLISRTLYSLSDTATFTWTASGTQALTVTAANCGNSAVGTHTITLYYSRIYLPLVLRN